MAVDWGEDQRPRVTWGLASRVFRYFLPYRQRGLLAVL
jgi:hypothetical protein